MTVQINGVQTNKKSYQSFFYFWGNAISKLIVNLIWHYYFSIYYIALCPMSTAEPTNDFVGIIHHEAGEHAFGFLLDECVYNQSEMPESRKKEIQERQKNGLLNEFGFH